MTSLKTTPKKRGPKPGARNLTESQKALAIQLWRNGDTTLPDLAKQFGMSTRTFTRLFSEAGVEKGEAKAEIQKAVEEELRKRSATKVGVIASRIEETREEHYRMASGLTKLMWAKIVETRTNKEAISTAMNDIKTIKEALSALAMAQEQRFVALEVGVEKPKTSDDDLPMLGVAELTKEEIEEIRKRQMMTDDLAIDPNLAVSGELTV